MQQEKTHVVLTSYSQSHVLQQRMKQEQLTHGQTVSATLSPVRLEESHGKMIMYFCPMQSIRVTEQISAGDGGVLPQEATLKGLSVPSYLKPGLYNLKNVNLYSNGTLQVIATEQTVFESFDGCIDRTAPRFDRVGWCSMAQEPITEHRRETHTEFEQRLRRLDEQSERDMLPF